MANGAFDPHNGISGGSFMGTPAKDQWDLVRQAKQAGMTDKDIADMIGNLFRPPGVSQPTPFSPTNVVTPVMSSDQLCRMICMRMRFQEGVKLPMAYMSAHQSNANVFVFLVHNEQATIIEDDPLMFPSDALITKLRLILG